MLSVDIGTNRFINPEVIDVLYNKEGQSCKSKIFIPKILENLGPAKALSIILYLRDLARKEPVSELVLRQRLLIVDFMIEIDDLSLDGFVFMNYSKLELEITPNWLIL